jgi:hypothetical protein
MRSFRTLALAGLVGTLAPAFAACGGGEATKDLATLKGDGFTVSMPGHPKPSVQSTPTPNGTVRSVSYTSDGKDKAFSIGYTTLPAGVQGDLHTAIAGGAAHVGGKAQEEKGLTYQGFKAREARITGAAGNKGTLFVRAILAKGRLYVLQFVGKGSDVKQPPAAYTEIVSSLKIG